jgi:hypothetical protein
VVPVHQLHLLVNNNKHLLVQQILNNKQLQLSQPVLMVVHPV